MDLQGAARRGVPGPEAPADGDSQDGDPRVGPPLRLDGPGSGAVRQQARPVRGRGARRAMTDRDALLASIHATPDDDAPRLVFADWLDEHGEPERAEFIRLQVAQRREYETNGRTDVLEGLFV